MMVMIFCYIMIVQQLICDSCKKIVLEKEGESYLHDGKFPISNEEASMLDKEHRGHECHIEVVEKEL
jgi:phage FluMu protein Com